MAKITKEGRRSEQAIKIATLEGVEPEIKNLLIRNVYSEADPTRDRSIYRLLIGVLAGVGLLALSFVFVLAVLGKPEQVVTEVDASGLTRVTKTHEQIPDVFLALGSAAIGALAGLLTPTPRQGTPQPDPPPGGPLPPPVSPQGDPEASKDKTSGSPSTLTPDDIKVTDIKVTDIQVADIPDLAPQREAKPPSTSAEAATDYPDTI